jgi:hypothetical protein
MLKDAGEETEITPTALGRIKNASHFRVYLSLDRCGHPLNEID